MPPPPAMRPAMHRTVFRRPADLVERTRWLFGACALVSLVLTSFGAAAGAGAWRLSVIALCVAALAASWLHRYTARRGSVALDLLDALAVCAFALASPVPAVALGVTFSALWFRAVYGRTWETWAYTAAQCAGLVAALLLWEAVPGHATAAPAAPLLGALPIAPLLAVVARHLASVLQQHQHAQAWDATLARLTIQLLGVTDVEQIRQRGWETAVEICRITPGLAMVVVEGDGAHLVVQRSVGLLPQPPGTIDRTPAAAGLAEATTAQEPRPITAPPELVTAAGGAHCWAAIPLPDEPGRHLLLGGSVLHPEGVALVQSLVNQTALAVRSTSAHRELEVQARTDALTGLANRSTFSTALAGASASTDGEPWVLFLDLDDFKLVNDRLGHAAGDELLRAVGARLAGAVRAPGLCARLGGDEFAVLVHAADAGDAAALARRLVEVASAPVQLAVGTAQVGASVGAACVLPGVSWTSTLQQADLAMYAAKAAGKNRVQVAGSAPPVTTGALTRA
ncbi:MULTISPECIES: GGDEF domain-containing protein [unclassified Modestobacter]|uniref:GGDEF domain-containing protein n=1 Tax=unclassified Modestobacter TaxID=2643866 RepID=UPI0022AA76CD|nr:MULTISPECIES: GGDEF domain-containing protein [unclassified Modestobacter]MCZ2825019.1 GGDEF domain-containing protein [Modestobacter sp. VKM Ac-2981]MCZ2854478.1 GGDEF domain-containing protein [Modestobacter sp. VKM Ac-2982]